MAIGTALAIGIGAAASAGASVAGGVLANQGAQAQARAAERSSEAAIAEQRRQFDLTRSDLAPWTGAGSQAVQRLAFLLGLGSPGGGGALATTAQGPQFIPGGGGGNFPRFDDAQDGGADRFNMLMQLRDGDGLPPGLRFSETGFRGVPGEGGFDPGEFGSLMRDFGLEDFETDPGYEFRLSEGAKALERSAAARGGLFSGGTLKALTRYNQGFASNEFSNAYNRFQQNRSTRYNFLANLAGLGQTSAGQVAGLGQRAAENIGNIGIGGATSAAAARASGYAALGQGISGGVNAGLNWLLLSRLAQNQDDSGWV